MKINNNKKPNQNIDYETAILELCDIINNENIPVSIKMNCVSNSSFLTDEEKSNYLNLFFKKKSSKKL